MMISNEKTLNHAPGLIVLEIIAGPSKGVTTVGVTPPRSTRAQKIPVSAEKRKIGKVRKKVDEPLIQEQVMKFYFSSEILLSLF